MSEKRTWNIILVWYRTVHVSEENMEHHIGLVQNHKVLPDELFKMALFKKNLSLKNLLKKKPAGTTNDHLCIKSDILSVGIQHEPSKIEHISPLDTKNDIMLITDQTASEILLLKNDASDNFNLCLPKSEDARLSLKDEYYMKDTTKSRSQWFVQPDILNSPTLCGNDLSDPATGLQGRDPATGLLGRDPATGLQGRDSATGLQGRDPATGLQGRDPATGLPGRDPATGLPGRDPATGHQSLNDFVNCLAHPTATPSESSTQRGSVRLGTW